MGETPGCCPLTIVGGGRDALVVGRGGTQSILRARGPCRTWSAGPSTSPLAVMARLALVFVFLVIGAGCVPVKTMYYEAVDRQRVPAATEGNLFPCPPIGGYGFEQVWGGMSVMAAYDRDRARVELNVVVSRPHQVTFETREAQLTSLVNAQVTSSVPLTFYVNCQRGDPEHDCPRLPAEAPLTGGDKSGAISRFIGVISVPPQFVDGFVLSLPPVFDGASRVDIKPLKYQLRRGVILAGLDGCR